MAGNISDSYTLYEWYYMNDGQPTYAAANASMELDFGSGGRMVNKVVVIAPSGPNESDITRINGVTMSVMNEQRAIILQYTFAGVSSASPMCTTFTIPSD